MSDLKELQNRIQQRVNWLNNRCGLTKPQKEYIAFQMRELVEFETKKANGADKSKKPALHKQNINVAKRTVCSAMVGCRYRSSNAESSDCRYIGNCSLQTER